MFHWLLKLIETDIYQLQVQNPVLEVHTCNPSTGGLKGEDRELETDLSYIVKFEAS